MRRPWVAILAVTLLLSSPPARADISWTSLADHTGVVVLMRHALAPGTGDPPGFDLRDCRSQRNLSAEGRRQARDIGREIRRSAVPVASVLSSPWCRARDTARLLDIGPVSTRDYLGSSFGAAEQTARSREVRTRRMMDAHAGRKGVLFLVGHQVNIIDLTGIAPDSGEAVVVKVTGPGRTQVLGTISAPG